MSTLGDLLAEHTVLPGAAVDHLHAVVGEWQLLADLSFGDFLMWVRRDDGTVVCVAQCRPTTASTLLITDAVGTQVAEEGLLGAVSVRYRGEVVALLTHQTARDGRRTSSRLEKAYLDCAGHLLHMLSEGTFPNVGDLAMSRSSPRVGDGFIRLNVEGAVTYASPNALSAYHRMGLTAELEGHNLVAITRPLISDPFEGHELAAHVAESLAGGSSMRLEVDAGGAAVLIRTLPLAEHGVSAGAALLIRDVTEVKRRDRALLSKDATIREIHHRVKNNLQTVAALLRLQARRTNNVEARDALIELKPHLLAILPTDASKPLLKGTAVMGMDYDYSVSYAQRENENIVWVSPEEGMPAYLDGWLAISGTQKLPEVEAFMNFLLEPKNYAGFINNTGSAFLMPDAEQYIDDAIKNNPALAYDEAAAKTIEFEQFLGEEATKIRSRAWQEFKNA